MRGLEIEEVNHENYLTFYKGYKESLGFFSVSPFVSFI